jgi:hypothetical protein
VRKRTASTKLLLRSVAAILLLSGIFFSLAQPAAAQDEDLGLVDDTEYQSPQFDFTMTWEDPWVLTEDSLDSRDGEYDTIQLESGGSFAQVILLFPTEEPAAYLDALSSNLEENNLDFEEIGSDEGDGYISSTVEFSFESGNDEIRVREYIEVGEIGTADGRDSGVFAGSFWSTTDDFDAEWDVVNENIARDGRDPLFLGLPEGIQTGTGRDQPTDQPTEEPPDEPTNEPSQTAGIDGNVFVGGTYGFSVEWDDSMWEAEDLSTADDDAVLLTSDNTEILFRTTNTRGGDVRTCVTDYAEEVKGSDDVSGFGRATGYPLPDGADGSFARLYDYSEGKGTRAESLLLYIQCRPFDGSGYLLISFKTSEAAYEAELENVLDVVDTIEFGTPPADNGSTDEPNTEPTKEPSDKPTAEPTDEPTNSPRDPVLDDTSYTGGAFDFVVEFDDAVWTAEELTPDDGYEGVSLSSDNASAFIEAIASSNADPDACVQATADDLETTDAISNVDEETRLDQPASERGVSTGLYSYTYTGQDGATLDFIEYIECRELIPGEAVLRVTIFTPSQLYEDEIPVWEDLLAGISLEVAADNDEPTSNDEPANNDNGSNADNGDLPGVQGDTYENPVYSFTLTWDSSWEPVGATNEDGVTTVTLSNGVSIANVWGGTFPQDPSNCVDELASIVEASEGITNFNAVTNDAGEPQAGGDDTYAYGLYSLTQGGDDWFDYIHCQPSPNGDYVVAIVYQMPVGEFATELTALEDFLKGLEID